MANNRIFYAVHAVGIGQSPTPTGSITVEGSGFRWIKGVQQFGSNIDFNSENRMELGQLTPTQIVEDVPEIELTIEKDINGWHSSYLQAVGHDGTGNIVAASKRICDVYVPIYPDTATAVSGTVPESLKYFSGLYIGSLSYSFSVDGVASESITLQGNDKYQYGPTQYGNMSLNTGFATINQNPHSPNTSVARRQHVQMSASTIPASVQRAIRGGVGNVQNINISTDFARDNLYELGAFRPYFKNPGFPIAVTCDFEVLSISGDLVAASGSGPNTVDESIKVIADVNGPNGGAGQFVVDLGGQNRLTSVNYNGGGTDGGNVTVTYSYRNFNKILVSDNFAGNGSGDGVSGQYWA